jgi:hypothetical protein
VSGEVCFFLFFLGDETPGVASTWRFSWTTLRYNLSDIPVAVISRCLKFARGIVIPYSASSRINFKTLAITSLVWL